MTTARAIVERRRLRARRSCTGACDEGVESRVVDGVPGRRIARGTRVMPRQQHPLSPEICNGTPERGQGHMLKLLQPLLVGVIHPIASVVDIVYQQQPVVDLLQYDGLIAAPEEHGEARIQHQRAIVDQPIPPRRHRGIGWCRSVPPRARVGSARPGSRLCPLASIVARGALADPPPESAHPANDGLFWFLLRIWLMLRRNRYRVTRRFRRGRAPEHGHDSSSCHAECESRHRSGRGAPGESRVESRGSARYFTFRTYVHCEECTYQINCCQVPVGAAS